MDFDENRVDLTDGKGINKCFSLANERRKLWDVKLKVMTEAIGMLGTKRKSGKELGQFLQWHFRKLF